MKLLPRQHKFVELYLTTLNASKAYREAYNVIKEDAYCNERSCKLLKRPNVKTAIDTRMKELADLSKEDINLRLEMLYKECKKEQSKIKILELQAKLNSLLKDTDVHQVNILNNLEDLKTRLAPRTQENRVTE